MEQLTATQLAEWIAYDRLSPIGEERADTRMSYIASLLTNLAISTMGKKGAKMTNLSDFVLEWDGAGESKPQQSVEEMKAMFGTIASSGKKKEVQNTRIPKRFTK